MGGRSCRRDQCEARRACMIDGAATLPALRGSIEAKGSLADFIWFRTGGPPEWLVRPRDVDDLAAFLCNLDPAVPALPLSRGSNHTAPCGRLSGLVVGLPAYMENAALDPATPPPS